MTNSQSQNTFLYGLQNADFEDFKLMYKENMPSTDLNYIGMFAMYDKVAGMFSNIFNNTRVEVLQRDLASLMKNDKTHVYAMRPENFDLFRLGTYHVISGDIVPEKLYICNLKEIQEHISDKL